MLDLDLNNMLTIKSVNSLCDQLLAMPCHLFEELNDDRYWYYTSAYKTIATLYYTRPPRRVIATLVNAIAENEPFDDLLEDLLAGKPLNVRARLRPPLFVPSTVSVFQLLETFRTSRVHLALVLDEFGAVEGLVTPSDVLEGLVGEMPSEPEPDEGPVVKRADGSWLVEGDARVEDVEGLLGLPPLPEHERGTYQTIAGFTMARLSRIPRAGDRFSWGGLRFEVVDMDGRRVDKVLVEREPGRTPTAGRDN